MKDEKTVSLRFFGIPLIMPWLKPYKKQLLGLILTCVVMGITDIVLPLFQRYAINSFVAELTLSGLGVFIALLLFISFVLINNTVRLNVFARRFTIHTMKLVGATRAFIRAPFMVQALFQGLFSAFIALILLLVALFVVRNGFAQLFEVFTADLLVVVMLIVLFSGVLICMLSTYFVVNKLVASGKDELYY